ncbi:SDR family oxidoreductase [Pedobacter sp. MC2016-05]|uniref:SDR family oxidoreductase n=1 Tax=Pedobacter sp. MC2016-05 TaxID=2994474 RepID=UPI00224639F0|nr:SDR family oxidoreductase [Pedobacter sp. MC2016-05]MCX2475310.1 SDR family oxidoreductase [Pedobacter sp. MC2016-05]
MNLNLKNKIIIVTGGAKGIGEAIVQNLAKEGACPIIIGRVESDNLRVVTYLKTIGLKADYVTADLCLPEQCEQAMKSIADKYNTIHGLVNNAGVNDSVGLESGSYTDFIASLHKNVVHYFLLAQLALPALKRSKGVIVNIGSKTAETGQGGTSGYAAANGARNALTREWAVDLLPHSIRVNAVIVAEAYTPLYQSWLASFPDPEKKLRKITKNIPLENRMTTVNEIANMVLFLLSDKSSHTTGQLIHVDGGYVHLDRALINHI